MSPYGEYEDGSYEYQDSGYEMEQPRPAAARRQAPPRPSSATTKSPAAGASLGSTRELARAIREKLAAMTLSPGLRRALQKLQGQRGRSAVGEFEYEGLGGDSYEMEGNPDNKDAMILAFKIPDAPYSDDLLAGLHASFEVLEGVEVVTTMFEAELVSLLGGAAAASIGVALGVAAPLAAVFANFIALRSGWAGARAEIAKERVKMGFATGIALGAHWRDWKYVKARYWEALAERNTRDQDAGKIAQKAYNLGLVTGFMQGRKLSKPQRDFFWTSLGTTFTETDRKWFSGDSKQWGERLWRDWYIRAAAAFIKLYVKE